MQEQPLIGARAAMAAPAAGIAEIYDLTVNNLVEPVGVEADPAFSWKMKSDVIGAAQTAYSVTAAVLSAHVDEEEDYLEVTLLLVRGVDFVSGLLYNFIITNYDDYISERKRILWQKRRK